MSSRTTLPMSLAETAIPCMLMRGGTSKGPFFLKTDLPTDTATRDRVLLAVMGSPDVRQIDGSGAPIRSRAKLPSFRGRIRLTLISSFCSHR